MHADFDKPVYDVLRSTSSQFHRLVSVYGDDSDQVTKTAMGLYRDESESLWVRSQNNTYTRLTNLIGDVTDAFRCTSASVASSLTLSASTGSLESNMTFNHLSATSFNSRANFSSSCGCSRSAVLKAFSKRANASSYSHVQYLSNFLTLTSSLGFSESDRIRRDCVRTVRFNRFNSQKG